MSHLQHAYDTKTYNENCYPRGFAKVEVPEGESGRVKVQKLTLTESDVMMSNLRALRDYGPSRVTPPGDYTRLLVNGGLMMSDVPSEAWEHCEPVAEIRHDPGRRCLINGLGLGMVLDALLRVGASHVTVIEINQDVINLVGPKYANNSRVEIICADALVYKPKDTYAVVWHDIWPDACSDNKPQMTKLKRKYARRTEYQGCWGEELIR